MPAGVMIPVKGFTPSIDPSTPGAILDCMNMVPTIRGMKAAPAPLPFGNAAFPSVVTGAATCELLSGSFRTFCGTGAKLYEIIAGVNTDVSRAAGGAYIGGANRWRFVQFGNATVATNGADVLQQSVSSGAFSNIAGAPIAQILETVQGFVFALGTNDGTFGLRPHGWWCSGLYDQTQWTPSQTTQCANGIIVDQPGALTAGRALGTNIIVYKQQSMYYGVYQGPPVIWAFNLISPIIGTPCQECVVPVGARHLFLGTDKQVYEFDGTIPNPIGDEVHEWLANNWSSLYQNNVQSYYDQQNSLVYWYFCSTSSTGTIDRCLVYNHRTGKFGRADLVIESAVQTVSGQITWAGMGSLPGVSTWSTLPVIPYNSPYWTQSTPRQGVIDTTHTVQALVGSQPNSSILTGWLGDDYSYIDLLGVVPRFSAQPLTCNGSVNTQPSLGQSAPPTNWPLGSLYDGEMGADLSTRYLQLSLQFAGNHELMGYTPRVGPSGDI